MINLFAAAIAFTAGLSARTLKAKFGERTRRKTLSLNRTQRQPSYAVGWLENYYRRAGQIDDLLLIKVGDRSAFIPFLTKPGWRADGLNEGTLLRQRLPHMHSDVPVDRRVVEKRTQSPAELNGDNIWNDLHACAARVLDTNAGPVIDVIVGEYFQYISVCGSLEDETYAAIRKPGRRTPIRDSAMTSADTAAQCRLGAHSIGMTVALVFSQNGQFRVLVQERSYAVSTYGGGLGVVPMFGCQTVDLSDRTPVLLTHNFLREVYEELYGGEAVEQPNSRVDPRWFLSDPSMAWFTDETARGRLTLEILGFGFDALNGQLIIGGLARVRDCASFEEELGKMVGNWEIRDIHVWDLFGEELSTALLAGRFTPACAFTLARTREILIGDADA